MKLADYMQYILNSENLFMTAKKISKIYINPFEV